jgi:pSer/pThr/pTyr-binding forkhead associated (FHA) protein
MARVILSFKGVELRGYELGESRLIVGRRSDSDIQLDDDTVSGRHAALVPEPDPYLEGHFDFLLEDLGSTNGTQVNGKAVTRHKLRHGDVIRIGRHEFLFEAGEEFAPDRTAVYLPGGD